MIPLALACLMLVVFTTVIHYEVLSGLTATLPGLRIHPRAKLIVVILTVFLGHAVEIALYGLVLFLLINYSEVGTLNGVGGTSLRNCLYFSAETYTSLGFGDLVPLGQVRLIAGVEALNGLLLIGWSAAYAYISMERFWQGKNSN